MSWIERIIYGSLVCSVFYCAEAEVTSIIDLLLVCSFMHSYFSGHLMMLVDFST